MKLNFISLLIISIVTLESLCSFVVLAADLEVFGIQNPSMGKDNEDLNLPDSNLPPAGMSQQDI